MSLQLLSRLLKKNALKRRNISESPKIKIIVGILLELEGSEYNLGYIAMCKRFRKVYELIANNERNGPRRSRSSQPVQIKSKAIRSSCAEYRLSRRQYAVPAPNYLWHADRYDKLRFGFAIYGCIDSYSKKVVWLHVAASNNDPEIIANCYIKSIQNLNSCQHLWGFLHKLLWKDGMWESSQY